MSVLDDERMGSTEISATALQGIRSLSNWKMFVSILFIVITSFGLLGCIAAFGMMSAMRIPSNAMGAFVGVMFFYILLLGAALAMNIILLRSAMKLNSFSKTQNINELEQGFAFRRKFWVFAGIMLLIFIILYLGLLMLSAAGSFR